MRAMGFVPVEHHGQQAARFQRCGVAVGFGHRSASAPQLARKFAHARDDVEVVGVLGGQPEGLLLTAATEHHRNVVAVAGLVDGVFSVIPLT